MIVILGILLALLVFSTIVFFHELGHFGFARLFSVKVREFGLGLPPRARKLFTDSHATEWTLNWLPIGGFVAIKGENLDDGPGDSDSLRSKKVWQQLLILLGGVLMNFILAISLLAIALPLVDRPISINSQFSLLKGSMLFPTISEARESGWIRIDSVSAWPIDPTTPLAVAGGQEGDRAISIGSEVVTDTDQFKRLIGEKGNDPFVLVVDRSGSLVPLTITPVDGKIGAIISNDFTPQENFSYRLTPLTALTSASHEVWIQSIFTLKMLGKMIVSLIAPETPTERSEAVKMVGGPIAIGSVFVDLASAEVPAAYILMIAALISINLGVFNLMPLPALDGGRCITVLLRSATILLFPTTKELSEKIEQHWHVGGFIFLMVLSLLVAVKDVFTLFSR